MFFEFSKILGFFAIPSNLFVVIGLAGVLLLPTRFARAGRRALVLSVILLALFGFSPIGNLIILPLEERFPPWSTARGAPTGVIVLGGSVDEGVSAARNSVALNESSERLTAAVALARRYPQARLMFTGGSGRLFSEGATEAEIAQKFFIDQGVALERIVLEDQSRNTRENATLSLVIAKPQPGDRWLLVTSAFHMPRSIGIFRQVGFEVEAYPVDWRTRGSADLLRPFDRLSEGLRRSDIAMREWVGLIAYWATGRTSEFFPGPRGDAGCDIARASDGCRPR
jgi:uncharacterized SAM-binding protein YcdF (DUF218 family)